jgi:hypothetical protein
VVLVVVAVFLCEASLMGTRVEHVSVRLAKMQICPYRRPRARG